MSSTHWACFCAPLLCALLPRELCQALQSPAQPEAGGSELQPRAGDRCWQRWYARPHRPPTFAQREKHSGSPLSFHWKTQNWPRPRSSVQCLGVSPTPPVFSLAPGRRSRDSGPRGLRLNADPPGSRAESAKPSRGVPSEAGRAPHFLSRPPLKRAKPSPPFLRPVLVLEQEWVPWHKTQEPSVQSRARR